MANITNMFLNIKTKYLQDPDNEIEIENPYNPNKEEDINMKIDFQEHLENKSSINQAISTKDSLNSVSTKGSSNNSSLASLSNSYNNNIFTFKFNNKEEYIKFNGDYINESYSNLLQEEKTLKVKPIYGYMSSQSDINIKMRAILVDWLIEMHDKFHLKSQTLYHTIWLIDTYLSIKYIKRSDFQLLGLGCLYISCKFYEIYYPQLKECVEATDGAYSKEDLLKIEKDILKTINYNLLSPSQDDFYNIISKYFEFNEKQYFLGKYFMEFTRNIHTPQSQKLKITSFNKFHRKISIN